jgi:hypothetical protein
MNGWMCGILIADGKSEVVIVFPVFLLNFLDDVGSQLVISRLSPLPPLAQSHLLLHPPHALLTPNNAGCFGKGSALGDFGLAERCELACDSGEGLPSLSTLVIRVTLRLVGPVSQEGKQGA